MTLVNVLGGPIQITVRVLDVNDNDPVFESALYTFSVTENTTAPLNVGTVTATDRDQGVCVCVCMHRCICVWVILCVCMCES